MDDSLPDDTALGDESHHMTLRISPDTLYNIGRAGRPR